MDKKIIVTSWETTSKWQILLKDKETNLRTFTREALIALGVDQKSQSISGKIMNVCGINGWIREKNSDSFPLFFASHLKLLYNRN